MSEGHDLAFLLKFYRSADAFRQWLDRCWATGFAHGEALSRLTYGDPDVAVTTRRWLEAATTEGWLVRGKFQPTPSQRFFDSSAALRTNPEAHWDAYGYAPNRDSKEAAAFLFGAEPCPL